MDAGLLRIETRNTGKVVVLPMHPDFASWLAMKPRGIGRAPVFPELNGKLIAGRRGLSVQFRDIAKKAGIMGLIVTGMAKGVRRIAKPSTPYGIALFRRWQMQALCLTSARSWPDTRAPKRHSRL